MKIRFSWRAQLIVVIEAVLILFMMAILWYINICLFPLLLHYNEENQLQTLQYVADELEDRCNDMESLSAEILTHQVVQKFYRGDYGMDKEGVLLRQDIVKELDRQLQNNSMLYSIIVRTSDGAEVRAEKTSTYNSAGNTWSLAGGEGKWSLTEKPARTADSSMQEYLFNFDNFYQGFGKGVQIRLNIDESAVREIYSGFLENGESDILICDQNGLVLSCSNPEEIGSVFQEIVERAQASTQGEGGSFVIQNSVQVIYLTIPQLNWIVLERMPVASFKQDIDNVRNILIWLLLFSTIILNLFIFFMMKKMLLPLQNLTYAMHQVQRGKMGYQILAEYHNEFDEIVETFNSMSKSIPELVEQNRVKEEQKQRYALSALRAQINPHFLFNTINTIKWMAISQQAMNIKAALDKLLILLRPLFKDTAEEITLQEELEYTANYISLVNLRFGGNIDLTADIPDKLLVQKVPSFILQPVIENCVEHGFQGDYRQAEINVGCEESTGCFVLAVQDNGKGISDERIAQIRQKLETEEQMVQNGDKLGLANVNLRIRLKYGKDYGVSLTHGKNGGTLILIKLPQIQ